MLGDPDPILRPFLGDRFDTGFLGFGRLHHPHVAGRLNAGLKF
ncbi:MAG: hypothetical protein WA746_23715 [Isosphaeraceae bacterium]